MKSRYRDQPPTPTPRPRPPISLRLKELGQGGSRSFSEVARPRSRRATLHHSEAFRTLPGGKGFPSPSLETQRSKKPNLGHHLGAASAAGPKALTIILVAVPPPRHAARPCAAEPSCWAESTEGTVATLADARTAARRAEWPARRRTRSRPLPEAQGEAVGRAQRCLGAPQAAGFSSASNRFLRLPLPFSCFPLPPYALSTSGARR